jgi:hypothetical protein
LPNVFIVNKSCHNYSDAKRFGKLVFMTEGTINRYAVSIVYREFITYMKDSDPEDFILVTGMSTMLAVACGIFSAQHGRLNLLLFKKGRYLERTLMFNEGE